jgi:hypothetical protein
MLSAPRGKTGEKGAPGSRGAKGDKRESGATIHSWHVDRKRREPAHVGWNGWADVRVALVV